MVNPGEIAATAGTSGVVYGVSDKVSYDPKSRGNTFLHVNHTAEQPRLGLLHCVNGCGILNSWMRRNVAPGMCYDEMDCLAASVPVGSDGVSYYQDYIGISPIDGDNLYFRFTVDGCHMIFE